MPLTVTVTPISVPVIAGDDYIGAEGTIPSLAKGQLYTIDLTFTYVDEFAVTWNITSITPTYAFSELGSSVVDNNPAAYKIRITGTVIDIFTDEYYRFLISKGVFVQQALAPDIWKAIVKWKIPSIKSNNVTHSFVINATEGSLTSELTQYAYWTFDSGVTYFKNLVSESI